MVVIRPDYFLYKHTKINNIYRTTIDENENI